MALKSSCHSRPLYFPLGQISCCAFNIACLREFYDLSAFLLERVKRLLKNNALESFDPLEKWNIGGLAGSGAIPI